LGSGDSQKIVFGEEYFLLNDLYLYLSEEAVIYSRPPEITKK
jgi:hypothetical protein